MTISETDFVPASGDAIVSASDLPAPGRVLRVGFAALAVLVALSTLGVILKETVGGPAVEFYNKAFYLDAERNIPTFFNFSLLMLSALLLLAAAKGAFARVSRFRWHWLGLAAIFTLMAFDEAARLHEKLIDPMRAMLGATGIFYFAWIVPAMAFLCVFALVYLSFVRALPRNVAALMVLAGAIYVGGAIGMEMLGGETYEATGDWTTPSYVAQATIEETMEMAGLIVFAAALVTDLRLQATRRRRQEPERADRRPARHARPQEVADIAARTSPDARRLPIPHP